MITHNEWSDKDREELYSLSEIVEILKDEIKNLDCFQTSVCNFDVIFFLFKECVCFLDGDSSLVLMDIHNLLKQKDISSFVDLYNSFQDALISSNIPDVNELVLDLDSYYDEFKRMDIDFVSLCFSMCSHEDKIVPSL